MQRRAALILVMLLSAGSGTTAGAQSTDCTDWQDCRARAAEAEAAGDFERFHDLAWRTMQRRGRTDPDVMRLLARAQALSGRPHDALVMLRRMTEAGAAPLEAIDAPAFERVRNLAGWAEVEPVIRAAAASAPETEPSSRRDAAAPSTAGPQESAAALKPSSPGAARPKPSAAEASAQVRPPSVQPVQPPPSVAAAKAPASAAPSLPERREALRVRMPDLVPAGFAYDHASGRFIIGNRVARTVVTISERLQAAADLVRSASAGFQEVQALAIDPKRGDLWVASAGYGASGSGAPEAALHKLQLVSGRPLATLAVDIGNRPPRFAALAVDSTGGVLALDGAESRLWRLPPGRDAATLVAELRMTSPAAMAVEASARHAYVAHADGVSRVSLANGRASAVSGPPEAGLAAIESLAWHRGSLIAVERMADVPRRLTRLHLGGGGVVVVRAETLDPDVATCGGPAIVTVSGDDVYYLAADPEESGSADCAFVVRQLTLR